jgi:hypothetical protein
VMVKNIELLTDLHVLIPSEYEKICLDMPLVCLYVYTYVCMDISMEVHLTSAWTVKRILFISGIHELSDTGR